MHADCLQIVFVFKLSGDTELAHAIDLVMARTKRNYILIIKVNKCTCTPCFYRVIETLMKVCENSKKQWKHSPAARVPTAFLVLPNFHLCFYNSIETWYIYIFYFLNNCEMHEDAAFDIMQLCR